MSKAYDYFLKAYNSYGKEKIDGVYLAQYSEMTQHEISYVEKILIEDAKRLDSIAILALGELKSKESERLLLDLMTQVNAPSDIHLYITEALWNITHNLALQETIIEDITKDDDSLRRRAVIILEHTTPTQTTFNAFYRILKTEHDSVIRTVAAQGILLYFGLLKSPEDHVNSNKYKALRRLLSRSTDDKTLSFALAEVEKEAVKLKG